MNRNVVCEVLYNIFSFYTVPVKMISKLVQVMSVRSITKNSPFYLYVEETINLGIFVSDDWLKLQIHFNVWCMNVPSNTGVSLLVDFFSIWWRDSQYKISIHVSKKIYWCSWKYFRGQYKLLRLLTLHCFAYYSFK